MQKEDQKALTPRSQDSAKWYQEVVQRTDMADYSPVRGCMVIKPYGYKIWELIQKKLDTKIKKMGAQNAYFPLFIPYSFLKKESNHVEGFAPEVATVTHAGGKKLEEKLAVRPTSETMIYHMFSQWIESYRDLPYKVNQWANVVRWEKRTLPFIRTSEFLWQEGHTLHAGKEEASKQVLAALNAYQELIGNSLALYGIAGKKTEAEKFAGAEYTYTIETMMRNGKALQTCTSHLLNHSFVESFGVQYQDENGEMQVPWATSWGLSTRAIGAIILGHGDDSGLVLPPDIAPIQIQIVPIYKDENRSEIEKFVNEKLMKTLEGYRVDVDWSDNSPGWKFNQSEMKGIPLRLEVGGREVESGELSYFVRYSGEKGKIGLSEISGWVQDMMESITKGMYESHKEFTEENIIEVDNYDDFKHAADEGKGFIKCYFNPEDQESEAEIKSQTHASTRCMPLVHLDESGAGFYDGNEGNLTYFAKAY